MSVFVCVCVDPSFFLSPLQQLPSIFITSHSDRRDGKEGKKKSRRNVNYTVEELKGKTAVRNS